MMQIKYSEPLFSNRWSMALSVALVSLAFLPLLTHSILEHAPEYDELLHIMSARSLNSVGTLAIADGFYTRAELYTRLIASVTRFSESELIVGRLPALAFGMALAAFLAFWVSVRAGWVAGLATAAVLVISPETIHSSVLVRFYTFHTLVMSILLLFWFDSALRPRTSKNIVLFVVLSSLLVWLGLQLHELSKITVLAGISGMATLFFYDNRIRYIESVKRHTVLWCVGVFAVLLLVLGLAVVLDLMTMLRGSFPLWSANKAGNYAYYVSALSVQLPFIWPLFPIMVVLAFIDKPRLTIFCFTVFLTALVINSLAAQKATRYFYHAYPMFCIIWGVGFQKLLASTASAARARSDMSYNLAISVVLSLFAVCMLSTYELKRGIKLVLDRGELDEMIPVKSEPDWTLAIPVIAPLLPHVDTFVVTSAVKGLYAFGEYDYELSTTVVQETENGKEFGTDPRTGRQVIGAASSVSKVIELEGDVLFVLENRMLNQAFSVPSETVAVLNDQCEFIDLTATGSQLSAWRC